MATSVSVPEYEKYTSDFLDCLRQANRFLAGALRSANWDWQGTYTIVPFRRPTDQRVFEDERSLAPFCRCVRESLKVPETCYDCDNRGCEEAARLGKPVQYWCDWGLREIAAPILVHGVCVGTILTGQKRLPGEADKEGADKLREQASRLGVESLLPELTRLRDECKQVTQAEVDEKQEWLWDLSQFLSQRMYGRYPNAAHDLDAPAVKDRLLDLSDSYRNLVNEAANMQQLWHGFDGLLEKLAGLLDAEGLVLLITDKNRRATKAASYGIRLSARSTYDERQLISNTRAFDGPQYFFFPAQLSALECPVCKQVLSGEKCSADSVLAESARLSADRNVHLFAFFHSGRVAGVGLYLHSKMQVLSHFLLEAVPSIVNIERIEALKQSLADKDTFLKDVSHQVCQPLHGLVADCDNLLSEDFPVERKARILKNLPARTRNILRMAHCVEYAARGDENIFSDLSLVVSASSLTKTLIENAIDLQGYAESSRIKISVEAERTDQIGSVFVDKDQLTLAITNVLYNAIKYSFPNNVVVLSAMRRDERVLITCSNTGVGIPREKWDVIFRRGERLSTAVSYSQSGLGIGLFVTRELMRRMGGDVFVMESLPTGRHYKQFEEFKTVFGLLLPEKLIERK